MPAFHKHRLIWQLLLVFIIAVPTFVSLLNNQYFSMHDDQHIVRLFLLHKGITQGELYPRWVDGLGFGFGYPLFNFYPPLIYYIAEIFHLFGISLVWSIKLTFITGFVLAASGMFFYAKRFLGMSGAYVATVIYTYFSYHAVTAYVRGALAEFFSFAIIPFVLIAIDAVAREQSKKSLIFLSISFALLIVNHPLIAFPALFYIGSLAVFYLLTIAKKIKLIQLYSTGFLLGLGLAAFFWLPSLAEKQFTMVDDILTKELADYKIHYVFPQQFLYSPWGYGGSAKGLADGMSFQLGRIPIALVIVAVFLFIVQWSRKSIESIQVKQFLFFAGMLFFSLFMATNLSSFIWDTIAYLWYLQFPWRFLTFSAIFIALVGGYSVYFLQKELFVRAKNPKLLLISVVGISFITIITYQKYFKPQYYRTGADSFYTTNEEIKWRISSTSFEFVPKGVETKKTTLGTTTLNIDKVNIPVQTFTVPESVSVKGIKDTFRKKSYAVISPIDATFTQHTYNFPGWVSYVEFPDSNLRRYLPITDDNRLRLITTKIPQGSYTLHFEFTNTPVRKIANGVTLISLGIALVLLSQLKKKHA